MTASPEARPPMLSLEQALLRLLEGGASHRISEVQTLPTMQCLGRVLAEAVTSPVDVPPADNTSMDGYALRCADVAGAGAVLGVSQRIPAGHVAQPLVAGTAARVFTGAPLPEGADAVVMQEACSPTADGGVRIEELPRPGQWIRRRGEDIRAGQVVLQPGLRLSPQALGLAASAGRDRLQVLRPVRVSLMSTGDELTMPGEPLKPGGIYNSNRYTLAGLLQAAGCEVRDLGIVPDRLEATREALRSAAQLSDLVLSSGGVSVGEEDHLRPAVRAEGRLELWQVAIKPGKPLAFGALRKAAGAEALFVGLPGNPVSSFVTFLLAVVPLLRALQGLPAVATPGREMRADFDWPRPDRRREFLRVKLNERGGLDLFENQSSGVLTSTVWADGLADIPAGQAVKAGDNLRFLPWDALMR